MDTEELCREILADGDEKLKSGNPRGALEDCFLRALSYDLDETQSPLLKPLYRSIAEACLALGDLSNAALYFRKHLDLCRSSADTVGDMSANGRIALVLKSLGKWDEALCHAQRQLELCRDLKEDGAELLQALYNLGNLHHAKAKAEIATDASKHGLAEIPESARESLFAAITHFKEYYEKIRTLGDLNAQGRVCGNLGNIYYLLHQYPVAIMYYQERLLLARECGDTSAECRGYFNLGNCHVLLEQFAVAEQFFLKALEICHDDESSRRQLLSSVENTRALIQKMESAHRRRQRHLLSTNPYDLASPRPVRSTGAAPSRNVFADVREPNETGFANGANLLNVVPQQAPTARTPHERPSTAVIPSIAVSNEKSSPSKEVLNNTKEDIRESSHRLSLEPLDGLRLIHQEQYQKLYANCALSLSLVESRSRSRSPSVPTVPNDFAQHKFLPSFFKGKFRDQSEEEDEAIFDLLNRAQSNRLNDQRCSFSRKVKNAKRVCRSIDRNLNSVHESGNQEGLLDLIAGIQSRRLNDQRAEFPASPIVRPAHFPSRNQARLTRSSSLPGEENRCTGHNDSLNGNHNNISSNQFFHNIKRPTSSTAKHLFETGPDPIDVIAMAARNNTGNGAPRNEDSVEPKAPLPDSFFDMLMKVQGTRMDDQRATIPASALSSRGPPNVGTPRREGSRDISGNHSAPR